MADQTLILSVDEEAKLLQPIDEYVGKIHEIHCKLHNKLHSIFINTYFFKNASAFCLNILSHLPHFSQHLFLFY